MQELLYIIFYNSPYCITWWDQFGPNYVCIIINWVGNGDCVNNLLFFFFVAEIVFYQIANKDSNNLLSWVIEAEKRFRWKKLIFLPVASKRAKGLEPVEEITDDVTTDKGVEVGEKTTNFGEWNCPKGENNVMIEGERWEEIVIPKSGQSTR